MQRCVIFIKKNFKANMRKIRIVVKLEIVRSNYEYHFIRKALAGEFENKITCFRKNTEKYITFSVPIKKEVLIIDKNGEKITRTYKLHTKFLP